ncbi:MAG: flagellar hook-associated protein FlgL [Limisphaerales bacterium]
MRISNTSFTDNFLNQVEQLQQQQQTLQGEVTTGLSTTLPEDNPAVMAQVLSQQTDSAANAAYQSNITQLQSTATTSATVMNSLQTLVSQVNQIATEASNGTNSSAQLSDYATQVQSLIQQAVQLGNTQDENGNYIFSGTACDTKPFLATTTNGKITAVTCALVGGTELAQSEIAPNTKVSAQVLASGAEGLFTNTTTGADLFNHMLALQSDLESGNTSAISSTDAPALQTDEDNIVDQISANAVTQSALSAASSLATAQSTNLTTQISGETSADMATTLTELSQTQTAYEAALESGTKVMDISLLNFLG